MRYEHSDPTELTLDNPAEFQAVGWAASEMRRANPDDPDTQSAYQSALEATRVRHSEHKSLTLHGKEADALLSVIKQWVDAGPPQKDDDPTMYPARVKSYRTACDIVARIVVLPVDTTSTPS